MGKQVDPISRIEGHLGVDLDVVGGSVVGANVHGNLWRGFENFLIGRDANDAITFTQRICGVCPIPHATASTFAADSVLGHSQGYITFSKEAGAIKGVPTKAVHVRNVVYASEFIMSHLTHFYHLVAPSYIMGPAMAPWTPYFNTDFYHPLLQNVDGSDNPDRALPDGNNLWSAVIKQYVKALRIRRLTFEAGALFAGRMPMTSSFCAGGVTIAASEDLDAKCALFQTLMAEVGEFIVKEHVPVVLALGALYPNYDNYDNAVITSTTTPNLWQLAGNASAAPAGDGSDTGYGAGWGNFLAWGAFPQPHVAGQPLAIGGGWVIDAAGTPATGSLCTNYANVDAAITEVQDRLVEDVAQSRYVNNDAWGYAGKTYAYPGNINRTEPERDVEAKYSWLKAPRWLGDDGKYYPMEVGPWARMVVNGIYPVDGTALATAIDLTPLGLADFADYLTAAGTGIDPTMVEAGLANALVAHGVATVEDGEIRGIIFAWLTNMVGGLSTMDRLRGRAIEALYLIQKMIGAFDKVDGFSATPAGWIAELVGTANDASCFDTLPQVGTASGFGVSEAPRGALAHFISTDAGKITAYQCVVPTTWNASPKDSIPVGEGGLGATVSLGAMEKAMVGIPYADQPKALTLQDGTTVVQTEGGVEALRVAQSFDPCIACAVH